MLRDKLLKRESFDTLLEAKTLIERWRHAYNTVRPHSAVGYRPPAPEARQPCVAASASPQRPHRAGLSEGEPPNLKIGYAPGAGHWFSIAFKYARQDSNLQPSVPKVEAWRFRKSRRNHEIGR